MSHTYLVLVSLFTIILYILCRSTSSGNLSSKIGTMYCLDRSVGNCEQLLSNYRTLYEAYYENNSCVLTSACMEWRDEFVLYDTLTVFIWELQKHLPIITVNETPNYLTKQRYQILNREYHISNWLVCTIGWYVNTICESIFWGWPSLSVTQVWHRKRYMRSLKWNGTFTRQWMTYSYHGPEQMR